MNLAFVFPGQGSQKVGMGRGLYLSIPECKAIFDQADDILGFSISRLCFEGPEEELQLTSNTQPALFVNSMAAFTAIKIKGYEPSVAAGHSVGEYAALAAAGALDFADALQLVRKRGELMQQAEKRGGGAMAALIGLNADQAAAVVELAKAAGIVDIATLNGPGQTVVSGEIAAVEKACEIAVEKGAKRCVRLNVSGAFHSRLISNAAEAMKVELAGCNIKNAAIPVVANATADYETEAEEIKANLAAQIVGAVRWEESVRRIIADGTDTFIECGAGQVLQGLIKRIDSTAKVISIGDPAELDALTSL